MIGFIGAFVIGIHLICASFLYLFPQFILFQFMMKDIYIVLMFKQLWSMIHSTIPASRAKYLYGCIFGVGTLGAITGSLIPSFFAVNIGSEQLFLCTLPLYLILYFSYSEAFKRSPLQTGSFTENLTVDPRSSEAFALIRRSPFSSRFFFSSLCRSPSA